MPSYSYYCPKCDRYFDKSHPMNYQHSIKCDNGHDARRVINNMPSVNWNGLPPHKDNGSPMKKNWIANAPAERDDLAREKELRGDS